MAGIPEELDPDGNIYDDYDIHEESDGSSLVHLRLWRAAERRIYETVSTDINRDYMPR